MNEREKELTRRKKEERRKAKEERKKEAAERAGGKKHTIKARDVGQFTWQQVKDAILAAGVATYLIYATPIASVTCIAIGAGAFVAKKLINAGIRFGKKHIVKNRKKPAKAGKKIKVPKAVAGALTAAGAVAPLILIPNPLAVVAAGISATAIAKITGLIQKKEKTK
jgi:hypothetical protein